MSKHSKPIRRASPPAASAPKRRNSGAMFIVGLVVVVAAVGFWWWKSKQAGTAPESAPPTETQATNAPPPAATPAGAVARPEFQKLKGKWLRPDGGYVIEIKSVTDAGAMDAAYFNPQPIHVAKAEVSLAGAAMKLFIELRDVNYPGSTYTLTYDPAGDQLNGIYYQALQQQSFEVNFLRMK